jgi:hypothetical protein
MLNSVSAFSDRVNSRKVEIQIVLALDQYSVPDQAFAHIGEGDVSRYNFLLRGDSSGSSSGLSHSHALRHNPGRGVSIMIRGQTPTRYK